MNNYNKSVEKLTINKQRSKSTVLEWIKAARPRTLPLSISGIILGSLIAKWKLNTVGESWDVWVFIMALCLTIMYQILSNYANDYGDGVKGTDKKRVDGLDVDARAVASGKISVKEMYNAIILFSILSLVFTVILLYKAFFPEHIQEFYIFITLGISCIFSAIFYTVGKKPYGYKGLGDLFVFIFFGLVSVFGSYYLFTKQIDWLLLFPATAVGLFSVAVLNLNNMRDIETDAQSGKYTLAFKLGFKKAMIYEIILLQLPLILILVYMMLNEIRSSYAYIFIILFFPLMTLKRRIMAVKQPKELDAYLKKITIICFIMSLLVGIGLNFIR